MRKGAAKGELGASAGVVLGAEVPADHEPVPARRQRVPHQLAHQLVLHERLPDSADKLAASLPARPPVDYHQSPTCLPISSPILAMRTWRS